MDFDCLHWRSEASSYPPIYTRLLGTLIINENSILHSCASYLNRKKCMNWRLPNDLSNTNWAQRAKLQREYTKKIHLKGEPGQGSNLRSCSDCREKRPWKQGFKSSLHSIKSASLIKQRLASNSLRLARKTSWMRKQASSYEAYEFSTQ